MHDAAVFWEQFSRHAGALRTLVRMGRLEQAFEYVDGMLQAAGYDLAFDLTGTGDEAVLVLTPEGDPESAALIDGLLLQRPPVPGWVFHGRRPRQELDDAFVVTRQIFGVDLRSARFSVSGSRPDGFQVVLHAGGLRRLGEEERLGAAATFLDHALGEETVMELVRRVAVDADPPSAGALSPAQMVQAILEAGGSAA